MLSPKASLQAQPDEVIAENLIHLNGHCRFQYNFIWGGVWWEGWVQCRTFKDHETACTNSNKYTSDNFRQIYSGSRVSEDRFRGPLRHMAVLFRCDVRYGTWLGVQGDERYGDVQGSYNQQNHSRRCRSRSSCEESWWVVVEDGTHGSWKVPWCVNCV